MHCKRKAPCKGSFFVSKKFTEWPCISMGTLCYNETIFLRESEIDTMEFDKKSARSLMTIVAFGVLLYWGLQNLKLLGNLLGWIIALLAPFLLGGCLAFVLNVPMKKIESLLFPKPNKKQETLKRPLSFLLTLVLVGALVSIVFGLVIPELTSSFVLLRDSIIRFISSFEQQHPAFLDQFVALLPSAEELKALDWESLAQKAVAVLSSGAGSLINSTVTVASRLFSGIFSFFMSFVFAIYLLLQKETLAQQGKKLLYAYLPEAKADRAVYIAKLTNKTFSSFLSGQCLEAVILGCLFFVAMSLFRFPYALMISTLIAVTALIPIFGAFIGCAVGAFMILMTDGFIKVLWFIVLFLVLQQLEGNLIYPKVVGGSVGLPSIWVFAAVSIGGSAFGVAGMLVFIPLCSVLYGLLKDNVNRRLKERKISNKKLH